MPTPTPTSSDAWYSGGTLHKATLAEWRDASDRNKLATAADWAVVGFELNDLTQVRAYAIGLLVCIDEVLPTAIELYGPNGSVTEIAATCVILMIENQ